MKTSIKDKILDLSAHYWLHLIAIVCIGALLYQNSQQQQLILKQDTVSRALLNRVARDIHYDVGIFLHETLLQPHELKQGEYRSKYHQEDLPHQSSATITYSYALPEERGRELLGKETKFREKLSYDIFDIREMTPKWQFRMYEGIDPDFLHFPKSTISISTCTNTPAEKKANYQQEPWSEEELLAPGYKWYTAEIEVSFPPLPCEQ